MKIKKMIAVFQMIVFLLPIASGVLAFYLVKKSHNLEENKSYIEGENEIKKYEKDLQDPSNYVNGNKVNIKLEEKDKDYVVIELYSDKGVLIYSSRESESIGSKVNINTLYTGVNSVNRSNNEISQKRAVVKNNEIIGIYKISLINQNIISFEGETFNVAFTVFVLVAVVVFWGISRLINKKIVNPIKDLSFAMKEFGQGKDINIRCSTNDEIGTLVRCFNKMKEEIFDKNKVIQKEQNAREYMIAAISHDMRTPLTSIRVYTELLASNGKDESKHKYTEIILERCDYMKSMIDNLFMYTILTSGYKKDFVKVEGEEFFYMLFDGYNNMCSSKDIDFHSYIMCSGEYKVNVNEMIRVIDNLVSNAINYTENGKKIWLGAFSKEYPLMDWIDEEFLEEINLIKEDGVVIVIKNQGEYIDKEGRDNIFKPFYKYDKSRHGKGGTGLGLSIVKLIIEQHGGSIHLFSKKKSGNTFVCFLKSVKA